MSFKPILLAVVLSMPLVGEQAFADGTETTAVEVRINGPKLPKMRLELPGTPYEYDKGDGAVQHMIRYAASGDHFSGAPTVAVLWGQYKSSVDPVGLSMKKTLALKEEHIYGVTREGSFVASQYPDGKGYFAELENASGIQQIWVFAIEDKAMLIQSTAFNRADRTRVWDAVDREIFKGVVLSTLPTEEK